MWYVVLDRDFVWCFTDYFILIYFILLSFFLSFFHLVFSVKPQEYKARVEKRNEYKNEILGHSKQAEFVRLMEHEVENHNTLKILI